MRGGVNKNEAYRISHNKSSEISSKSCSNRASELLKRKEKEIEEYILELNRAETDKRAEFGIWDENKSIKILNELINTALKKINSMELNKDDANIVINCVKEINKILGLHKKGDDF